MIISDGTIRNLIRSGELGPDLSEELIQPASVDMTLGMQFVRFDPPTWDRSRAWEVDPQKDNSNLGTQWSVLLYTGVFSIYPGEFVLGCTAESVSVPSNLVARVEGKSSLARLGLAVHATAGFIDPGFQGQITLEFSNLSPYTIKLRPSMKIAQLSFEALDYPAEKPYGSTGLGSKYQNQTGATPSAYHLNA